MAKLQGRCCAAAAAAVAMIALLALLAMPSAVAVPAITHPVGGDNDGFWALRKTGYYQLWADRTKFVLGDSISFKYDPSAHNVIKIVSTAFPGCQTGKPLEMYKSGNDVVSLTALGPAYYTSGFPQDCSTRDMKFSINVVRAGP